MNIYWKSLWLVLQVVLDQVWWIQRKINKGGRVKPFNWNWGNLNGEHCAVTCLREMGNVMLEDSWGGLTISLTMSLQVRHTPAQATTLLRRGHLASDDSIRRRTSLRSSWGMLAHQLCSNPSSMEATTHTPFGERFQLQWWVTELLG